MPLLRVFANVQNFPECFSRNKGSMHYISPALIKIYFLFKQINKSLSSEVHQTKLNLNLTEKKCKETEEMCKELKNLNVRSYLLLWLVS